MQHTAVQHNLLSAKCRWMVLAVLLSAGALAGPVIAYATTIYSYIDEQGNPRFSDSMDNIPEKYRAKVKTHEQAAPQERPLSALEQVKAVVSSSAALVKEKTGELLQGAGVSLPSAAAKPGTASPSPGMNTSQSQILNYAGAAAIVRALRERDVSGLGQYIDMALFDTVAALTMHQAAGYFQTGKVPTRQGNSSGGIMMPYETFKCADGHLIVACGNNSQWQALCKALARDDLAADPRFASRHRLERAVVCGAGQLSCAGR